MINEKLEKLNQEIAKGEARLRRAQHEEKILEHQVKQLTRKERTHRLCTRGAMLESFLLRPEVLTDEDVMDILKQAFSQSGMKEIVAESVKGRVAGESLTEEGRNYTPPKGWCIAFSEGSSPEGCDFPQSWSAPNHTGDATLPLRWLSPATLLWTCRPETPCAASCSRPASFISRAILIYGNLV